VDIKWKIYTKRELQYYASLYNIKKESNEVTRRNSQSKEMIIDLIEDNICLSRSLDKAQKDKGALMNINMKLQYELYDGKAKEKI